MAGEPGALTRLWNRLFGDEVTDDRKRHRAPRDRPSTLRPGVIDRRSEVRIPIELRVAVRFEKFDDVLRSTTLDLSRGGAFLSTRAPRAVGTKVRFSLEVAGESAEIRGCVVRRVLPTEVGHGEPGMGVDFESLDEAASSLIERILASGGAVRA